MRIKFNIKSLVLLMPLFIWACDQDGDPSETLACMDDSNITLENISLDRIDGEREDFSQYLGKLVVMNIWATWCAPCIKEMPALQALSNRLDPEKGLVIGVSVDRKPADTVQAFLNEHQISFTNYIDPKQDVIRKVLGVSSLPETFIFGPSGCLIDRVLGIREWDSDEVYDRFDKIMNPG